VGDVYKTLFPKDSRLNLIHSKISKGEAIQSESDKSLNASRLKVGSLRLAGMASRKVINLDLQGIQ
jgi:hypothetical protein